jgi:hypothetical protein
MFPPAPFLRPVNLSRVSASASGAPNPSITKEIVEGG